MTTNSGCPHGFPNPKNCFECMEEGNFGPPPEWEKVGFPFYAKFDSTCSSCGDPCLQGQGMLIQRYDKPDKTIYVHYECKPLID